MKERLIFLFLLKFQGQCYNQRSALLVWILKPPQNLLAFGPFWFLAKKVFSQKLAIIFVLIMLSSAKSPEGDKLRDFFWILNNLLIYQLYLYNINITEKTGLTATAILKNHY